MKPLYAHCPHCGFPAVVRSRERALVRYCRQCRGPYVPAGAAEAEATAKEKTPAPPRRRYLALRALWPPRGR